MTVAFKPTIDGEKKSQPRDSLDFLTFKNSSHTGTARKKEPRSVQLFNIVIHHCSGLGPQ